MMSYIYIPKTEYNPDFGQNPNPGFIGGALESLQNAIDFGLTNEAFNLAQKGLDDSHFLTPEQFNQSEYKRPGLDFNKGVHLDTAKRAAERHDAKLEYEQVMGGMSNGFLRGTSQLVGGTIGFALDPANLAIAAKVPMLAGSKAAPYLMKLAESPLAKRALQTGIGVGEGAAIMAPQAIANYSADSMYGEDPGVLDPLINIGLAAVAGGIIRGAFGFKENISANADNAAKQTAVGQLASGKSVRVDELMQHGAYEADLRSIDRDNIAALPKTREQLFTEDLSERIKAENQAKNKQDFMVELQQSKEGLLPIAGEKLSTPEAKSLTQEIQGLRQNINKIDKSFDDYVARIRQENKQATYKEAVSKANKAVENDKKPLQDALYNAETKLKNHEAAKAAESELSRIDQRLAHLYGKNNQLEKLAKDNFQLEKLFEPQLINKPISVKRILDGDYNLDDLFTESHANTLGFNIARQRLQNSVASLLLDGRRTKPLTTDQVKAASEHMQSYKSDSTYNEAESNAFRNEVDALPENIDADIEHVQRQTETLQENLPEDIKQSLEELKTAGEKTEKVGSALQKIIDCLIGE
jgi:hypothetical protein